MTWSLPKILSGLHDVIERHLTAARDTFAHPGTKGDAAERVWLELLQAYLPARYRAEKAIVVDSKNAFSEQIDVVIFDRQYTPPIFSHAGQTIVPAESVYAVFETKQTINAGHVDYAQKKVASVRRLHRTSKDITHAGGTFAAKQPAHILGGILTLESDWNPALGKPLAEALSEDAAERLDLGCVAAHGIFGLDAKGALAISLQKKPATAFLLELIDRLQDCGTVTAIDTRAYARWLDK
jgi:hypothetical protein